MIYFDNNATTKVAPGVLEKMIPYLSDFYGNPSSAYTFSSNSRAAISESREGVATLLGAAAPNEIVFTSGGTESDNWAILGTLEANREKTHVITTRVEHEAVRNVCTKLETNGFDVTWLDVDQGGSLDLAALSDSLREDTAVVSIMMANNETGVIFPVNEIAKIVKDRSNAVFHVDGVNAVGKIPIDLKNSDIDLFSISGHKFHGPKGIGALYIRDGIDVHPLKIGGGQEGGRRAGTEAVHQIVGLGAAADFVEDTSPMDEVRRLRDKLEKEILETISNSRLNGDSGKRLPNTSNISFENLNGEAILARLNDSGFCVSTGSACNEETRTVSPVLQAMDIPYSYAMGSIRFSLGRFNSESEVDSILENLVNIVEELRRISS